MVSIANISVLYYRTAFDNTLHRDSHKYW